MKRSRVAAVVLAMVVIAAAVAYPRYRAARQLAEKQQRIEEALAKDAAYTETLLKMELESTGVTYKELFDFCEKSIDQRNTLIVEMRVNTAALAPMIGAAIIDFLNAENGFARAKRAFLNASLEFDTAKQAQADNNAGFDAVARRTRNSARGERQTARERLAEAEANLAELEAYLRVGPTLAARVRESAQTIITSISSFRAACESLISKEKKLVSESAASGMAFRPVFAPYYQQSIEKANETEKKTKIL
jgi:hypothetical protein